MDMKLNGLRVLITAGASGIGLAAARAFAREGARVHVSDVNREALDALARSDPALQRSVCDVADRSQVAAMFDDALAALGGLDVLVNNAGIAGPTARCEDVEPAAWERTLAVNITGQFHCAQLAIPHLRESRNPSIVNLSSAAGRFGFPLRTPYAASKWAVIGFTKSLSIELGSDGIRVNAICPGSVAGARIESVYGAKAAARGVDYNVVLEEALAKTSLHRLVTADDIANTIVFLCSPAGANISGQAIAVLDAAEREGFEVFVTTDSRLRYRQNLGVRRIAVVCLLSTSWPRIQRAVRYIIDAVATALPGSYKEVDVSR